MKTKSAVNGGSLGGALGVIVDVALSWSGHPLPAGNGTALGAALAVLFIWFAEKFDGDKK